LHLAVLLAPAPARADLSPVEDIEWAPFRAHCLALLQALEAEKAPLPTATTKELRRLLAEKPADPQESADAVRKLLDAHCLVGTHINAESRVKAARGAAPALLVRGSTAVFLVRVHNEGGVRHPLAVEGPQVVRPGKKAGAGRWLEASVASPAPLRAALSGGRLEYRLLRLKAREAGKREATLRFDVGQGSQDLGFRAEVPILFIVRPR
jgi:hypothetical protein